VCTEHTVERHAGVRLVKGNVVKTFAMNLTSAGSLASNPQQQQRVLWWAEDAADVGEESQYILLHNGTALGTFSRAAVAELGAVQDPDHLDTSLSAYALNISSLQVPPTCSALI
jgi:hypothetical protein